MDGVLEIFDQKGIIDYLKDRVYPTYMGTELLSISNIYIMKS